MIPVALHTTVGGFTFEWCGIPLTPCHLSVMRGGRFVKVGECSKCFRLSHQTRDGGCVGREQSSRVQGWIIISLMMSFGCFGLVQK